MSNYLEQFPSEDIETITLLLAKISHRSPSEIKPHLITMLEQLVQPVQERPFYETASRIEWVAAFRDWVETTEGLTCLHYPMQLLAAKASMESEIKRPLTPKANARPNPQPPSLRGKGEKSKPLDL